VLDKINIREIISDHLDTLRTYETRKRSIPDLLLFFVAPLVVSVALVRIRPWLTSDLAGVLATSLSVFAALLFNLILLIYDVIDRADASDASRGQKGEFLRQIYSNVSFCILVCIMTLLALLVDFLHLADCGWFRATITVVIYYLVGVFILTLFMVLKRIHILLRREVKRV
jgi:hypothetical protein